eukprot:COSAG05_NODE_7_length_42457_cov_58.929152_12_plen_206_part_00
MLNYSIHPRYLEAGLPDWVRTQVQEQGAEVGYYARGLPPMLDNHNAEPGGGVFVNNTGWLRGWLDVLGNTFYANAFYVDEFGRKFEGSAQALLALFGDADQARGSFFPPNTITEGWVDFSPYASLLSGDSQGWGGWLHGVSSPTDDFSISRLRPFAQNQSGTFINMIRLLQGDALGYYGNEDSTWNLWGPKAQHYAERQAFLLGA